MAPNDFIRAKAHAALGTRFRRLSEQLERQVEALYAAHKTDFQPRWYPVVTALVEHGALSVGELAAMIGMTHAAISQIRGELKRAGMVRVAADPHDRRRQILQLSAKGKREAERLAPLWATVAQVSRELVTRDAPGLLQALDRFEDAIRTNPIPARVHALAPKGKARRRS